MTQEINLLSILYVALVSLGGGITGFLYKAKCGEDLLSAMQIVPCMALSLFVGVLVGILCMDLNYSFAKTIFICGVLSFISAEFI
ncbi:hypothetical protein GQQ23_19415 [Pantoea agglomerans]|uniref:phage holin family protein n=1 Tax=Enterobacter agglomerans TaxID=549 RepID=UPI0013CCB820|nr:phage holin family protein [Pantoea agglomerans]NEG64485.1 hypothetical protein [Pantoea agglomerans]